MSTKKNIVENTEKTMESREGVLGLLVGAMTGKTPSDVIVAQEAAGQRQLVNSAVLPTDFRGGIHQRHEGRAALERSGVVFGDPVEGDLIFQHVTLPEGWKKVATNHHMWSNLVDNKGRVRASIFYKAAFYDRSAHLNLETRFKINQKYGDDTLDDYLDRRTFEVKDGDNVLFTTGEILLPPWPSGGWENPERHSVAAKREDLEDEAKQACRQWLVDHGYPDWEDPSAYWDV